MAMAIEIPKEYGYVVLVVVAYVLLNLWMGVQVGKARKRHGVPYPALYAPESADKEDANLFNCVQRGHQNSLELLPVFLATLLLSGLQHPLVAAGLGLVYTAGRFLYFKGYSTGVPDNRLKGGIYVVGYLGLIFCTAKLAITLLTS